jgi:hypothetical protein
MKRIHDNNRPLTIASTRAGKFAVNPRRSLRSHDSVRSQGFWDRERLKIRESLARLVCNVIRLADRAVSGGWRFFVISFDLSLSIRMAFPRPKYMQLARRRASWSRNFSVRVVAAKILPFWLGVSYRIPPIAARLLRSRNRPIVWAIAYDMNLGQVALVAKFFQATRRAAQPSPRQEIHLIR